MRREHYGLVLYEGINRYNGQSVTVFHPSQDNIGLTENEIMAICGNKRECIHTGTA